jgi:drug/metabolite transporter (DMT)-like permease
VIGLFLFGKIFNKERFTKDKMLATFLGFIGIALVFSPNINSIGILPLFASALSGFATSVNLVLLKKVSYNATQSTLVLWITSVLANLMMAILFQEHLPNIGFYSQWIYLLLFALASVAASWLFVTGLKLVDAGAAGILGLLEIVFAVVFGVIFFHEKPSTVTLVGIMIIIAAATIPYLKDYNATRGTLE